MEKQKSDNLKWWVLLTVIIGTFLGRLDQTIVGLALPDIMDSFGITVSAAGWISTAYIIANAIFVPIWGKLGDILGRKKIYIIGFSIFIVGSILCGLAWNLNSMIAFRILQAIAGSADYPTAMAIIAVTFPQGKDRAQAMGLWSSSFAAATVFGPLIGGPLIDNFGWPSVFLVNIPVGIVGILMALAFVHESKIENDQKPLFDWWGAVSLGVALASLVLVLEKGLDWGWLSGKSIIAYAITLIATYIFIKLEQKHSDPIIDLNFFKNNIFVNVLINNFIVFMGMMGAIFLLPVFAQSFMGYDATKTGFLFMPMAAAMMLAAPFGANLTGKVEARWVIMASTLVAALGLFLFSGIDAKSGPLDIIIPLSIMAFGLGFGMSQRTNTISAAVPPNEIGSASSVLALCRNIAGAFGIAVFGTILNNSVKIHAMSLAQNSTINVANPIIFQKVVGLISLQAQILSYKTVFIFASIVVLIGGLTAYWIKLPKNTKLEKVEVE